MMPMRMQAMRGGAAGGHDRFDGFSEPPSWSQSYCGTYPATRHVSLDLLFRFSICDAYNKKVGRVGRCSIGKVGH
eukprot:8285503-Pyramimonas_sp.AAC.1